MILGVCPLSNTGPIPTKLANAGFPLLFFNLLQTTGDTNALAIAFRFCRVGYFR
jgi:hypothetical protein